MEANTFMMPIGALSILLKNDVTLPAGTSKVTIGDINDSGLCVVDTLGEKRDIKIIRRGATDVGDNQVLINGIQCYLSWNGQSSEDTNGYYALQRITAGSSSVTFKAGDVVMPRAAMKLRHPYCSIIWMGTNGGGSSASMDALNNTFVKQIHNILENTECSNYIVIGMHMNPNQIYKDGMAAAFGPCFIDINKYLVEYGCADAGITPTAADIAAMEDGVCPPSLLRDGLHPTDVTYQLIGQQVLNRMIALGIV